ncbi:MAG: hypothetical protein M1834_008233 [Cirrosporium novae-zelandiae]|nr:MAG: hypothetical protein M1834_008233 [Cirrosporium novae-zelandiae]
MYQVRPNRASNNVGALHHHNSWSASSENIPLEQRPTGTTYINSSPHAYPIPSDPDTQDEDDDPDPDSDAAFLKRHFRHDHLDHDTSYTLHSQSPGILAKIINIMSKVPLIGKPIPSQRYGSVADVPPSSLHSLSEFGHDGRDLAQRDGNTIESNLAGPSTSNTSIPTYTSGSRPNITDPLKRMTAGVSMPAGDGATLFDGATAASAADSEIGEEMDEEGQDGASNNAASDDPWDNSPYAQVRASVSAKDNYTLSISTPRMWILSICFAFLGSATNLFFSLRYPSVTITPVIALVLVHPFGKLWDFFLKRDDDPVEVFTAGVLDRRAAPVTLQKHQGRWSRIRLWLAQGKWNEKEHACVYISSNVSFGFAFATDVIVEQHKFYKQDVPILYQVLLTLSTQILGYAFAGLTRRYLVRPSAMIWPGNLMSTAMFSTMHKKDNKIANGWKISRYSFFLVVWAAAFMWYFVPGLLMPALSYFNVITWFAPKNVVVANLFGVASGLGLFPMTFDWAQIAYIGSPLLTPWWAAANVVGGLVVIMWLVAPLLYYMNVFYSSFMPILSSSVFDDTGKVYNVSRILTKDFLFDQDSYNNYSRVYLPITYVLSYAVQFAGLAALVSHTACWNGKELWQTTKETFKKEPETVKIEYSRLDDHEPLSSGNNKSNSHRLQERGMANLMSGEDVHNRLMKRYEDAPMTWYLITFVSMLAVGLFVVEYYPIHLPWYGLLLAIGITCVLFIPVGIVMAITNQHCSLYLMCQIICGFVFPGRPVANMVFVTYCYISSAQGVKFASDLKLGHYMKIPPRLLFYVQLVATLVSSLTQIGVLNWMFLNIPGICTSEAINGFICPLARVHFNGSILWGVIGPQKFFGKNALYRHLMWAFLVGAVAPVVIWVIAKRSKRRLDLINLPVAFGSLSWIPPATGLNFSIWAIICFLFNFVLRRRAAGWWSKYTMTLSAALDSGLAFGVLVVFFGFLYPGWMKGFSWWGTEVYKQGCDWQACAYKELAPGEHFGPRP